MTPEEKQLLLIDLCARLPYGVKVNFRSNIEVLCEVHIYQSVQTVVGESGILYDVDTPNIKPYLRPLSSMTEKEIKELENISRTITIPGIGDWYRWSTINPVFVDYLNSHYLDWRGLIPMGLALEAPEGMYKIE